MFNFINIENINLFPISVSANVSGVVLTGEGTTAEAQAAPSDLPVPWRTLQEGTDIFSMLQWRTAISEFAGRKNEMDALKEWAYSDRPISAKFVVGEGGVGKTRLAAELAEELRKAGWAAGFPDLRNPSAYFAHTPGTLLIVDYPEELPGGLESLFTGLARLEESQSNRLRVLFLSRREADAWRELALDTNADAMIDWLPVHIGPLQGEAAYAAFHSALERAAEAEDTVPPPVSVEVLDAWLGHAPENDRALFIVAAALFCALHPDVPLVDYKGRDVLTALVERELARLRRTSKGVGLRTNALSELLAFAAIRDGLDPDAVSGLASQSELHVQFPQWPTIVEKLGPTSWLSDDGVVAPKPDILAACLVVEVFRSNQKRAPDWLWAAIEDDVPARLETLGRLIHDAETVLGLHTHRLSDWLVLAFEGHPTRCFHAVPFVIEVILPVGLMPLDVAVWKTLADVADDNDEKSRWLTNLSVARASVGDNVGALEAIREAVDIYRRLAPASPARYEPDLAQSMNNLSNTLSEVGDAPAALEAIREAVEIRRRLAAASPERYEPDLAQSLNNLSIRLSAVGDAPAALEAIRGAVEIRRRLAAASPARYEPVLALNLNNLSNRLSEVGDAPAALEAIREAVEIRRRLAAASPARYEPDLAQSLNNLSTHLGAVGDAPAALEAIRGAVEIRRRLAAASPARYEPDLARSLSVLSDRIEEAGETGSAIEAREEALHFMRPYAERYPESEHGRLYRVMQDALARLTDGDNRGGADDSK